MTHPDTINSMAEEMSIDNHIAHINEIANQAAELGYFGLQDSCLLIIESLQEHYQDTGTALPSNLDLTLSALPVFVDSYLEKAPGATQSIIQILGHPDLNISLAEDEQMMLEQMLSDDIAANDSLDTTPTDELATEEPSLVNAIVHDEDTQTDAVDKLNLEHYSALIGECASHAADNSQYGLQDACLLVQDALDNLPSASITPELLEALSTLPQLIEQHSQNPIESTTRILTLIRHPELNIAITDDELGMLKSLLLEGHVTDQEEATPDNIAIESEGDIDPPRISSATLELVELLQMEAELVGKLLSEISLDASLPEHLTRLVDELDRYTNAANIAGFEGLAEICVHLQDNLNCYYQDTSLFDENQLQLLQNWLDQVKSYLATFTEDDAGLSLLAHISNPDWPQPLTPDKALAILQLLRGTNLSTESNASAKRQQFATEADITLTLPADVNQELLEILLQELPSYTQEFSEAVHNLQKGGSIEDLDIAQRVAHTLKGSANTVGIGGIANLTHHLEDILEACAKAQQLPNQKLLSSLIDASDCLEAMSDYLIGQSNEPPYDAQQVLQDILDLANHIDQNGLQDFEALEATSDLEQPANQASPPSSRAAETDVSDIVNANQQAANIRVPSEQIDTLLRMSGESLILNTQANERLRRIKAQLLAMETQFTTLQRLSDELEELIDIKDLTGKAISNASQEFDSLEMDQYNELYTTSRRLIEAAFDAKEMNLDAKAELEQMGEVLEYQQRLVIDTQSAIMETRLVPVATITPRLQRTLRQTCRLTGKACNLSLSGEHLMVDNDVLSALVDPLMHILRNAIDHGIENEAERRAANKSLVGHLHIDFDREGNNILVRCKDDGHGLDFNAIRATAIARGVVQPDQPVTEEELKRFILRPNFSTRSESTQVSGRGVGMNVVHHQVMTQGGSLTLKSDYGQGLTVELRMPLPISRSHAILALAGSYRVAITSKGLKQIIYANAYDFYTVGEELILRLDDGTSYPTITLNRLLHVAESRKKSARHNAVLLVQHDETTTAVILDNILDSLDIVIKDFGQYIKKIPGYIGAAILGDGTVSPVLDMPELLRLAAETDEDYIAPEEIQDPSALLPKVLVVDDSLSQRRALEQLLTDAGFAVQVARDGIEAAELLAEFTPDIMLTDLEMPRMNGIELTAHVRGQPRNAQLPIIMITSRTTQKHHKMAEEAGVNFYIAKPVREDDLLGKIQQLLEKTTLQTDVAP